MDPVLVALSLTSAGYFGAALVLTQVGLRYLPPLRGTATSLPSTALLFLVLSLFMLPSEGTARAPCCSRS
jgi:hypothetical protein